MDEKELQIKRLGKQDVLLFQKLIGLFQEVFEMENKSIPSQAYLNTLLEKPGFVACVVIIKNEVAGGLTAYELPMYYSESSELFIYDIAIHPNFQRKGIGEKLLLTLKTYCKENNIKLMFVSANEEDEHAIKFYHSTGGKAESVVHFNYEIY